MIELVKEWENKKMSDKVLLLFGVYDYLLNYLKDDTEGYENIQDTVISLHDMYCDLDETYKGLEPRLYEFAENMLWSHCIDLIDMYKKEGK